MDNKVEISAVLKRNLKEGKEYDKLIPRVKCGRTNLGEGDTFNTVDWMKDWIEKYSFQTTKISAKLKGRSLEETVNNIYRFLYDHVQYTADGALQQLRSPACTWAQRKEGVDCKSYSVFASSILSNMGINHFIRQVRQPYFFPDEFTHVYVVVPKDQDVKTYSENAPTFVLDATKHQNTEGSYIEKVDLHMTKLKHIGLNAPQDERTQKITRNFENFSRFLLQKGITVTTVNAIRDRVSQFTSKGKDPRFDIVRDGILIEGVLFPLYFTEKIPFKAVEQSFKGGLKGSGLASFSSLFEHTGIPTITGLASDAAAGIIDGGLEVASSAIPFGSVIKDILDNLGLQKNISNVLKYGLSSWGASTTPEETKKRFAEVGLTWLQSEIASVTPDNIDTKLTAIDVMLRGNSQFFLKLMQNHSRAKSTRLANEWVSQECTKILGEILDSFNAQLQSKGVKMTRKMVGAKSSDLNRYPLTNMTSGADLKVDRYWNEIQYAVYTVDKGALKFWNSQQIAASNNQTAAPTNTSQPTGSNNYHSQTGQTGNLNNQEESKSNTGLIVGGVALASIPLLFMMKKPAKKASK